jgi:transposase
MVPVVFTHMLPPIFTQTRPVTYSPLCPVLIQAHLSRFTIFWSGDKMAGKELDVFEARELIRRLKMKQSGRSIASDLCISRETVKRYKALCEDTGWLLLEELPSVQTIEKAKAAIKKKQSVAHELSSVLPFKPQVEKLLDDSTMTVTVIHQRLKERGYEGSYSSVSRFVSNCLEQQDPEGFCRMEVAPGAEGQVDFGYIGMVYDPVQCKKRKAWVFYHDFIP